ncbi:hypothetical protein FB451DRAFT_1172130 [Mycena latifolia]|nr:hypothetical protein FB451DRAFT_1172130 [Mycena latifolia]
MAPAVVLASLLATLTLLPEILCLVRSRPTAKSSVPHHASTLGYPTSRLQHSPRIATTHFAVDLVPCPAVQHFSRQSTDHCDTRTLCVCGYPWNAHNPLPLTDTNISVASQPPAIFLPSGSAVGFPSVAVPPQTLPLGFSTAPLDAFVALPRVTPGTANARRTESASRSLPQHQGAVANASSSHRGPRNAYPSFSTSNTPFSANSFSPSQAASPSSSLATGPASPFDRLTSIAVLVWPFVVPGEHEPAGYPTCVFKIRTELALNHITAFRTYGLFFHPRVPLTGLTSPQEFTRQLTTHLAGSRLHLALDPNSSSSTAVPFNRQPWVVLTCTRYQDITTFKPHPAMNDNTFGFAEFKKLGKKLANPDPTPPHNTDSLIVICPRYDHIRGPITSFSSQRRPERGLELPHPCYGLRILDQLQYAGNNLPDPECYQDHCPSDDEEDDHETPEPERPSTPPNNTATLASLIRQRSPGSQADSSHVRRVRQRQQSHSSQEAFNVDIELPDPERDPPRAPRPAVVPFQVGVDVARVSDVARWQNYIRNAADAPLSLDPVQIYGDTVEAVAQCVLDLLLHIQLRKHDPSLTFRLPKGVRLCDSDISLAAFFLAYGDLRIGTTRQPGVGQGPQRAAFRTAAKLLLTSQFRFWKTAKTSEFILPNFIEVPGGISKRLSTFTAHGTFLALHCALLGHAPLPVSIWLILALVMGKESMLIPKNVLLYLDPGAYDILAPWYDFHHDTPVPPPAAADHPLWKRDLPRTSPPIPKPARPSDQIFHHGTPEFCFLLPLIPHPSFHPYSPLSYLTQTLFVSHYVPPTRRVEPSPRASRTTPGIDLKWIGHPSSALSGAAFISLYVFAYLPDDSLGEASIHILLHDSALSPARPGHFSVPLFLYDLDSQSHPQPANLDDVRTEEEHKLWTIMIFSRILLGYADPWDDPEFKALQDGFNIALRDGTQLAQTIQSRGPLAFLLCMYDRRIKAVEDVSNHLAQRINTRSSDNTTIYFAKLFDLSLRRYMQGVGHPSGLRGLGEVTDDEFLAEESNPLLRSNLVLSACGDTDMRPMDDAWKIRTSMIIAPMHFHTCSYEVDVKVDLALQDLLLEGMGDDDTACTTFDTYIHSQFLNRTHNSI